MNENLDLVEVLKDCPAGTKLYSAIHGEVTFNCVRDPNINYPIDVDFMYGTAGYTRDGRFYITCDGECVLFPSKDQRDWSKFKAPVKKFDYSKLQPYDRVLVRSCDGQRWRCGLFSRLLSTGMLCECSWGQGIPYNDETKHLVGTTDMPDEKYIWWEE